MDNTELVQTSNDYQNDVRGLNTLYQDGVLLKAEWDAERRKLVDKYRVKLGLPELTDEQWAKP